MAVLLCCLAEIKMYPYVTVQDARGAVEKLRFWAFNGVFASTRVPNRYVLVTLVVYLIS